MSDGVMQIPQVCSNEGCRLFNKLSDDGTNCMEFNHPQFCPTFASEPDVPVVHNNQQQKPSLSIFETIAAEIGELVTAKNLAYGNSFAKCGDFLRLLYPAGIAPAQYDDALAMVRIFDKQMRIATQKDALGESPYRDIAGYGILGAAKDQGKGE